MFVDVAWNQLETNFGDAPQGGVDASSLSLLYIDQHRGHPICYTTQ